MILGLWKNTELRCGYHTEPVVMELRASRSGYDFCCPQCKNKISSYVFEKALNEISKVEIKKIAAEEWGSQANTSFAFKTIRFEVLQHEDNQTVISVRNPEEACK